MKKITMRIIIVCAIFTFTFSAIAQHTSAQFSNNVRVSQEMQAQIQEALSQQTIINPQTSNRAPMAATYVGSFNTSDGPDWTTNPPALSAVQAAAFIFGGSPSDYVISTNPNTTDPLTITHTAWATTWGVSGCQEVAEDYFLDLGAPGYNDPGGTSTAISAYVTDNCTFGNTNYVWLASQSPSIFCPGNFNVSNDLGICGAVVNYTVTATDAEDGVLTPIQTAGLPSGSTFPIGTTTNTFEATDSDNNTVTCSFDVTVNDNEAPVITCASDIVQNNDLGLCGAVITYNFPTATDNCSALGSDSATFSFTGSVQQFTVPAGVTEIRAAVYGAQGGANWVDNINYGGLVEADIPVIPGQTLYVYVGEQPIGINGGWNGGGNGEFAGIGGGGASDIRVDGNALTDRIIVAGAGGGAGYWSGQHIVGGLGGGLIGGAGYRDTPANAGGDPGTQTSSGNGTCGSFNNPIVAGGLGYGGAPDNCGCEGYGGGSGYYGGAGSGNCRGGGGGSSYTDPTLTNVLHSQGVRPGNGEITITWVATLEVIQTAGLTSGSTFPVGTTTNTFVATDAAGNTSTCSFDVTINDTEAPVFTDIYGDGTLANPFTSLLPEVVGGVVSGNYYFSFNGNTFQGALDNDTDGGGWLMILNYVHQAGDNPNLQVRNTDLPLLGASILGTSEAASPSWGHFGNVLAADIDFEEVRFYGQTSRDPNNIINFTTDYSAVLDYVKTGNGSFSGINNPANYTLGASHNASIPQNAPDFFSNEGDFALTNFPFWRSGQAHWGIRGLGNRWEVDDFTNNSFSTIHRVWVKGDLSPTFNNDNATITVQLDGSGNVTVSPADFGLTTDDNCGTVTQTLSETDFDCSDIGSNTIQLTATDAAGNETTIDVIVNVEDTEAPVITCVADVTRDTDSGVCQYTIVGAEFDATFTDNCTSGTITNDFNGTDTLDGEILPTGDTTVIWTVDDGNGQTATCTTVITIEDNEAPIIACPADITANTSIGDCFATVSFTMPYTQDNCGIDTVVQTMGVPSGSQFPVGITTIEFTTTDVNGNVSTCTFTITVIDNEAPVAVCQNITIQLDEFGDASITAADVDGGSADQCGVASISIDMDTFDCSNVGDNNVILTVTDVNGNISTCIAIVTVEDVTAPVVACQNITVELDPITGTVTIAGTDIDNGSTDACGIGSYDLDIDTFDCSNIGDNTVVLTVTDVNGNTTTCTAIVTVEDNTNPVLVCQDFTLQLGADGTATLNPTDVIASNDDACGIFTVAVDITEFSCADIGTPVTVQVFSQDNNGNLATCMATVTVVDLLAPVVTCPANQTVDPGAGNLFYIIPDYFATGEATAIDNCTDPVTITTQDPAVGTPLSDGVYTITLTATDEYGNVGTCEFELTVATVLGAGNNNQNLGSIAMYPNPAKSEVTIGNPQNLDLERADIYDLTGRLVQSFNLKGMATAKTLNVDNLAAATYVVIINGKEGQITKRLLKE